MISFACHCGQPMQAQAEYAGKRTKCPACGAAVTIPSGTAFTDRPAWTARGRAEEDEGNWDDDRPRRRGKRRVWPWVAAAALVLLLAGGVTAWLLWSGGAGPASADLALVRHDAVGFASVRVADLWNSDTGKTLRQQLPLMGYSEDKIQEKYGLTPADVERATFVMPTEDGRKAWAVVSFTKAVEARKVVTALFPGAQEVKAGDKTYFTSPRDHNAVYFLRPTVAVVGSPETVKQFVDGKPSPARSGPMDEGLQLAEAGGHHVVAAFNLPPSLVQKLKAAPVGNLGGQANLVQPFLEIRSGLITAKLGGELELDIRVRFPDEVKAKKARETAESLLALARMALPQMKQQFAGGMPPQVAGVFDDMANLVQTLKVTQEGDQLRVPIRSKAATGAIAAGLLVPAVQKVREAANRTAAINNLRQLAIGMHFYDDSYKRLPPARLGAGLSWRVAILPFIEQESLYKRFHLNEPWDSPHNLQLLPLMPKVFAPPEGVRTPKPHSTFLKVFTGPGTPFDGQKPARIPASFPGGTSNAFLIVEAADPVEWTRPDDIAYDPNGPLPRLGGMAPGSFLAVLGDASVVRFERFRLSDETLRAAIAPGSGKRVGPDWQTARR
jgi:hypothetical protein